MTRSKPRRTRTRKRKRQYQNGGNSIGPTYFIVTASLIQNGNEKKREQDYKNGIAALKRSLREFPELEANSKIIIVENNGKRPTFLDSLGVDVFYTENNKLPESNKGVKELRDILDTIKHYNLKPDDFVVKLTGRYSILANSPFMKAVANRPPTIDAIVRYGFFEHETGLLEKYHHILTGLVGLKVKYIQQIPFVENLPIDIEQVWAETVHKLPEDRVQMITRLGIDMPVADGPVLTRGGRR